MVFVQGKRGAGTRFQPMLGQDPRDTEKPQVSKRLPGIPAGNSLREAVQAKLLLEGIVKLGHPGMKLKSNYIVTAMGCGPEGQIAEWSGQATLFFENSLEKKMKEAEQKGPKKAYWQKWVQIDHL